MGRPLTDRTGMRYGRLIALERADTTRNGAVRWRCRCDCGTEVVVIGAELQKGATRSCGCLAREVATVHGLYAAPRGSTSHPLFATWRAMIQRCYDPRCDSFVRYGGRGITVDDRWRAPGGFPQFAADMGAKPTPAHSLDRIDPEGPYAPQNCRWATPSQQASNKRPRTESGIVGVYRARSTRKWKAMVTVDGRYRHLGVFPTVEAAAQARGRALGT